MDILFSENRKYESKEEKKQQSKWKEINNR